jgi:hypothetical protein
MIGAQILGHLAWRSPPQWLEAMQQQRRFCFEAYDIASRHERPRVSALLLRRWSVNLNPNPPAAHLSVFPDCRAFAKTELLPSCVPFLRQSSFGFLETLVGPPMMGRCGVCESTVVPKPLLNGPVDALARNDLSTSTAVTSVVTSPTSLQLFPRSIQLTSNGPPSLPRNRCRPWTAGASTPAATTAQSGTLWGAS